MSSGVTVNPEVLDLFHKIKVDKTVTVAFFCLSKNGKEIVVDKGKEIVRSEVGDNCVFEKFIAHLPRDDCRYVVFDVKYVTKDSGEKDSLVFISWNPESSSVRRKMLHASSKGYIKKELDLEKEWCINDMEEALDIKSLADNLKGALSVEGRNVC
ncbi:cofilin-1-A-like [Festucalex cinctus]